MLTKSASRFAFFRENTQGWLSILNGYFELKTKPQDG